jgi:glutathione synthase
MQVELNTIASSFACLSSITRALHAHMLDRVAAGVARRRSGTRSGSSRQEEGALPLTTTAALSSDRLPPNDAMAGIARALAAATVAAGGGEAVMLMVVQPGERNAYDQQVGWG